jgi:hypothetical protein
LLTLVLAVTGCSTGTPKPATSATASTPGASSSPSPTAAPAPVVGSCHAVPFAEATQPQDSSAPVPCRGPHTAQTVRVGDLSTLTGGDTDVDSTAVRDRVAQACSDRLLRFVGGTQEARRLSRFEVVWFTPTADDVKAGATWFRCDVVGLAAANQLIVLPRTVKGALDQAGALDRFGTCGTAAPGKPGFQRVVCRRKHSWQAVATVDLARTARYLGPRAAAQGDSECKDVAAARANGALKYTWSFEWPTRAQWSTGQRYGYCWVPA